VNIFYTNSLQEDIFRIMEKVRSACKRTKKPQSMIKW